MMTFDTYIEKILADIENLNYDHIAPWEIVNARKELARFKEAAQGAAQADALTVAQKEEVRQMIQNALDTGSA